MASTADPTKLKLVREVVQKIANDYQRVYMDLYRGAADGYGYGKVDSGTWQVLRMPRYEGTLPEVPNKLDVSPDISVPEMKPITATARDFRAKFLYLTDDAEEDKIGFYAHQASGFAQAIERTVEIMAHEPFNKAKDATYTSGWDGKPLADAAHLIENGGTYDNTLTAAPPSETLLENIYDYANNIPSASGWPLKETTFTIITGPAYARQWKQILGSTTAIESPSTAGGANANPAVPNRFASEDGRVTVVSTPYLLTPTMQFVLFNGHELAFKERWRKTREFMQDDPEAIAQVAKLRLLNYWGDARRVLVIG